MLQDIGWLRTLLCFRTLDSSGHSFASGHWMVKNTPLLQDIEQFKTLLCFRTLDSLGHSFASGHWTTLLDFRAAYTKKTLIASAGHSSGLLILYSGKFQPWAVSGEGRKLAGNFFRCCCADYRSFLALPVNSQHKPPSLAFFPAEIPKQECLQSI